MTPSYTGKDVVQMAMDMEQTGRTLYESLALGCDNPQVATLAARLAKAEQQHYTTFAQLLSTVFRPGVDFRMSEEQQDEAHRLVTSQILPDRDQVRKVGMGGRVKDALALAIQMETDSIAFYQAMLPMIADGRPAVSQIIADEQSHLRDLQALRV